MIGDFLNFQKSNLIFSQKRMWKRNRKKEKNISFLKEGFNELG